MLDQKILATISHLSDDLPLQAKVQSMHMTIKTIMSELVTIERRLQNNTYLNYVFHLTHNYTDFSEFITLFDGHHMAMLSHHRKQNTPLPRSGEKVKESKVYQECQNPSNLLAGIKNGTYAGDNIFVLCSVKDRSRKLFETMTKDEFFSRHLLLAENITGGVGKCVYKANNSSKKVVV